MNEQPRRGRPANAFEEYDGLNKSYLWGRCEGWAQLGTHHAVVVDVGKGEARDEKGEVLARWVDGGWRVPSGKYESWQFDQVAVTHVPVDPHSMSKPDWLERRERQREKAREAMRKRREDGRSAS